MAAAVSSAPSPSQSRWVGVGTSTSRASGRVAVRWAGWSQLTEPSVRVASTSVGCRTRSVTSVGGPQVDGEAATGPAAEQEVDGPLPVVAQPADRLVGRPRWSDRRSAAVGSGPGRAAAVAWAAAQVARSVTGLKAARATRRVAGAGQGRKLVGHISTTRSTRSGAYAARVSALRAPSEIPTAAAARDAEVAAQPGQAGPRTPGPTARPRPTSARSRVGRRRAPRTRPGGTSPRRTRRPPTCGRRAGSPRSGRRRRSAGIRSRRRRWSRSWSARQWKWSQAPIVPVARLRGACHAGLRWVRINT